MTEAMKPAAGLGHPGAGRSTAAAAYHNFWPELRVTARPPPRTARARNWIRHHIRDSITVMMILRFKPEFQVASLSTQ